MITKDTGVWRFLWVDADLGLDPAGVEAPEIGGLLDLVILGQALPETGDPGEVLVHVQVIGGAGADLSVHRHEHKQCRDWSVHFFTSKFRFVDLIIP